MSTQTWRAFAVLSLLDVVCPVQGCINATCAQVLKVTQTSNTYTPILRRRLRWGTDRRGVHTVHWKCFFGFRGVSLFVPSKALPELIGIAASSLRLGFNPPFVAGCASPKWLPVQAFRSTFLFVMMAPTKKHPQHNTGFTRFGAAVEQYPQQATLHQGCSPLALPCTELLLLLLGRCTAAAGVLAAVGQSTLEEIVLL